MGNDASRPRDVGTLEAMFRQADGNGDGMIDQFEFDSFLASIGLNAAEHQHTFHRIDGNADGHLSMAEVINWFHATGGHGQAQPLAQGGGIIPGVAAAGGYLMAHGPRAKEFAKEEYAQAVRYAPTAYAAVESAGHTAMRNAPEFLHSAEGWGAQVIKQAPGYVNTAEVLGAQALKHAPEYANMAEKWGAQAVRQAPGYANTAGAFIAAEAPTVLKGLEVFGGALIKGIHF